MTDCPQYTSEELHIFDELPSSVLVNVDDGKGGLKYAYSNAFLAESLGYTNEELKELLTNSCFAAIYEADWEKTKAARARVLDGEIVDSISRQKKKDGSIIWVLAHIRKVMLDGKPGIILLFSGVQELVGLQNELSAQNKTWNDILQSVPVGLLVYKEEYGVRTTLSINRVLVAFANAVGTQLDSKHRDWSEAEMSMILNQDIYAFCENEDVPLVAKMLEDSETKPITESVFRLRGSKMATAVYIHATCSSKVTGDKSRTYYVTYQNVTEAENRKRELIEKQELLFRMSYYDTMTDVRNRNAYNQYSEFCKNNRIFNVGFAFCDINGLKKTNDTLGHYHGDRMIQHFIETLKEFFDRDSIYRISGDEFVVIYPNIDRESFQDKMKLLLSRIEEDDNIASIGYVWKESASDIQRRVTQAEQLMYIEKQRYYEINRTANSKHRPRMLESLLKEFEEKRFVMFLQPKTSIDGSKVIGAEALARKYDPDGNLILPYAFVPQLEHERLIPILDFFMLDETCKFLEEQHHLGNDSFAISVNISRVTIAENDFIRTVSSIMDKYDFEHYNLELELTESSKTLDSIRLEEYLVQLKKLGVMISLDDMGTDYSSLSLLTVEGFDWVKLDRSFVIQLDQEKVLILVKHMINTCHDLNLKVIAEGVETDECRELLMGLGCDAYQGYLKSRPIPAKEFKEKFL